jgi:2-phosphosulfolactate phosphatase
MKSLILACFLFVFNLFVPILRPDSRNSGSIMNIEILHLLEGARQARGMAVIIDVFRAFSTACYAYGNGACAIYPAESIEEAFSLKKKFPDAILAGERNERRPDGFDLGNSPLQLLQADVRGKKIIHATSSGTRGIANAVQADVVITGSFVNAEAIARFIRENRPDHVSLVCMGYACEYPTDEDTLCAGYIRNLLTGRDSDLENMKEQIRNGSGARFFEESSQEWAPSGDFELCLQVNKFDFVLKVVRKENLTMLVKTEI